jgi:uncharacterized membrane protein YwzB
VSYIPFLHPIDAVHDWSFLLIIPLSFGISVIYKALRLTRLDRFWRHVAVMTTQIVLSMIALAIALTIIVQVIVPMLPVT